MELQDVLNQPPQLHAVDSGELVSWGLVEEVLRFMGGFANEAPTLTNGDICRLDTAGATSPPLHSQAVR